MQMNPVILTLGGFISCAILIVFSGVRLSKYGDIIADLSGLGKAWIGLILMAAVTSLPELFSGFSSILILKKPDIAVGAVFGSCAFNLAILALLDFFVPGKPISSVVTRSQILAGFLGMILIILSVIEIHFGKLFPERGWFGLFPGLIIFIYLISIRIIFENDRQAQKAIENLTSQSHKKEIKISLKKAIIKFFFYSVLIVAAALALPYFAEKLAQDTGINESFVGTLLVAASTSLPEMVVSIAAVRMGSIDLAVGNLLGSNIFNMFILAIDDLIYTDGPILLATNPNHALSALVTLLMTSVISISILFGSPKKRFALGVDAIIMILLYAALLFALNFLE
jgi:cation:H+ antiporter